MSLGAQEAGDRDLTAYMLFLWYQRKGVLAPL